MKFVLVYNLQSEIERNLFNRLRNELGNYIVAEYDFQEVKNIIPIRATPAMIPLRDDLQGDELLDEVNGQLRITAEAYKIMQEEDLNIYQKETNRIDYLVNLEVQTKMGENYQVLQDAISLLNESGVV